MYFERSNVRSLLVVFTANFCNLSCFLVTYSTTYHFCFCFLFALFIFLVQNLLIWCSVYIPLFLCSCTICNLFKWVHFGYFLVFTAIFCHYYLVLVTVSIYHNYRLIWCFALFYKGVHFEKKWVHLLKFFANIFIFGCGLQPLYLLAFMIFYNLEKWLHLVVAFGYFFRIFPQTFHFGCYL